MQRKKISRRALGRAAMETLEERRLLSDVAFGAINKIRDFVQTSTAAPTLASGTPFVIEAVVDETADNPNTVSSASISGTSIGTLALANLAGTDFWVTTGQFASAAALDAAVPNNEVYSLQVNAVNDGTHTFKLNFGASDDYPATAVQISDFNSLQSFDPTQPITVTWDPISGGTVNNYVRVEVEPVGQPTTFHSPDGGFAGALNATDTSYQIPAGTMQMGKSYTLSVILYNTPDVDTTDYPGVNGAANFGNQTIATITTLGSPSTVAISNGRVVVTGSTNSDTIAGGVDPSNNSDYYFLVQNSGANVTQTFPIAQVTSVLIDCDPVGLTPVAPDDDLVNFGGDNFGFAVSINGGAGSDTVFGQAAPNDITTGTGSMHNLIYGGAGSDSIQSEGSDDTLRSGGGTDTIRANTGNNILVGGKNGSRLWAGSGHDTLRAGIGNSTLHGGANGTFLLGGTGNDVLDGGSGNDTIIGSSGHQQITGGAGDDFLDAGNDAYLIFQGGAPLPEPSANDSVDGSAGTSDTLVASSASPTLKGGSTNNDFDVNDPSATLQNVHAGNLVTENDTIASATQTITVHLTIQFKNGGSTTDVVIPSGAGAAPSGTSAAETTNATGTVVFRSNGPRVFTLGDFFNHWGVDFNAIGVGQLIANSGSGHTLSMTVNGVNNTSFNNYQVQNGDAIVITFTQ